MWEGEKGEKGLDRLPAYLHVAFPQPYLCGMSAASRLVLQGYSEDEHDHHPKEIKSPRMSVQE